MSEMLIIVLDITDKKNPKCPSKKECLIIVYSLESYAAIKKMEWDHCALTECASQRQRER